MFIAQTRPAHDSLEYLSDVFSRIPVVHSNVVCSSLLTRAVLDRMEPHAGFYLWMFSALLEYNYLAVAPWARIQIKSLAVPWLAIVHVIYVVYLCSAVAQNTFAPGQRRIPVESPSSLQWERRDVKAVELVCFKAFGPKWLSKSITDCQILCSRYWRKLVSSSSTLQGLQSSGDISKIMLLGASVMISNTSLTISGALFYKHGLSRFNLVFSLMMVIAQSITYMASKDPSRMWFIEDMFFHQALKVDGRYYELTRTGWFANSIKFEDPVFAETDRRDVLTRRHHGYTFFTHEEICQTAKELIKTSPGYELLSYNCISMRNNLFMRIKDHSGALDYRTRRRGIGYINPYLSMPATIAYGIYGSGILCHDIDSMFGSETTKLLFLFAWHISQVLFALHQIRGIAFWSSTAYGNVYRNRKVIPLASGLFLATRAFHLCNPSLDWFKGSRDNQIGQESRAILVAAKYILFPTTCLLIIRFMAWIYSIYLSDPRLLTEVYWDNRFETADWSSLGREYYPGEREALASSSNTTQSHVDGPPLFQERVVVDHVNVRVKYICGTPLVGESTITTKFWPQSQREVLLLLGAIYVFTFPLF